MTYHWLLPSWLTSSILGAGILLSSNPAEAGLQSWPPSEQQRVLNGVGQLPQPQEPQAAGSLLAQTVAESRLESVRITPDGFFFRTSGNPPELEQRYSDDRRQIVLELKNTAISPQLAQRDIAVTRYQVSRIQLLQLEEDNLPTVRITLTLAAGSPEWQATSTNLGGVVLVPVGGVAAAAPADRTSQTLTSRNQPALLGSGRGSTANPDPLNIPIELPNVADRRVRIAIDPGHGGRDPGAVGINGLQEKGVVLDIAQRVAELLEQQGAQVIMTRQNDTEIGLEPRVQDANRGNAALFVSIHANAIDMSNPQVNGLETYYYSSREGYQLARTIQASATQATGMRSIGVKEARFYVLRHTRMPAALVEVGFVTGRDDAPRLANPEFRDRMAQGIARGILQYVQQHL